MPDPRPRLLYVVTLAETGGAQSYVRDLLPAARESYDVTLAAHGDGPLRTAALKLGVDFVPLRHVRRALSPVQDPLGVVELTRLFRRVRPDIVHLNSSKAGVLGRIAGTVARVPVRVFTAHGWAFMATGSSATAYRLADRAVRSLTSMVVCVSEADRREGLAANVCTPERSLVIPNAVEVGPLVPRTLKTGGPVELVGVGRLVEQKDFATLVSAVARLPVGSFRLRLLGEGPLRPALEAQIGELGLGSAVELVGEVNDVHRYLEEADIFVLSSRFEGMPIAILEAMTASLPVVASNVGGVGEVIVDGETGFLVEAGRPERLAARIAELLDDPARRLSLGAAARKRAEDHFSLPRWQQAHLELYRSLLDARTRP